MLMMHGANMKCNVTCFDLGTSSYEAKLEYEIKIIVYIIMKSLLNSIHIYIYIYIYIYIGDINSQVI